MGEEIVDHEVWSERNKKDFEISVIARLKGPHVSNVQYMVRLKNPQQDSMNYMVTLRALNASRAAFHHTTAYLVNLTMFRFISHALCFTKSTHYRICLAHAY